MLSLRGAPIACAAYREGSGRAPAPPPAPPPVDSTNVDMLTALSWTEADYHSQKRNVLGWAGKSTHIFKEIESYYGFVGGPHAEYVAYLNRADRPPQMWTYKR